MHDDVLAFFITWSCYGTFLPGDDRGWTKRRNGEQPSQPFLADWCRDRLSEEPFVLDEAKRQIVEQAIRDQCAVRGWKLLAVNCRTTHCHVVVAATGYDGEQVRDQFKAWSTRRLKQDGQQAAARRRHWWTRKGSVRKLYNEDSIHDAVVYVLEAQDHGGSKFDDS